MPLFKSISVPNGLLAVWQITEPSDELLTLFSPQEIADPAFQKFTYEKRKAEWLATRALLKQMIGSGFKISYSEVGKPLLDHSVYHYISISHSRDFVTIFIHQQQAVGVDIESMNRNYAAIEKRYLSETELEQANKNPFLKCLYWCAKEAVFKLEDEEGIDFRKQIEILAFELEPDVFFARFVSDHHQKTYQLQYTTFDQHCMVWVCSEITV